VDQVFQIMGAALILVAFAGLQRGSMDAQSRVYLVLNLVGSAILTGVALYGRDWGFLMLEIVWALVSAWGLAQVLRGREPDAAH
jgi:hypothetical protein